MPFPAKPGLLGFNVRMKGILQRALSVQILTMVQCWVTVDRETLMYIDAILQWSFQLQQEFVHEECGDVLGHSFKE